jgi:linear primary-alkylsulfatase
MNTYFPQFKAMWMAENSTNTLHNLLTLRRAQVRDGLRWAGFLNETIELYGDGTEVKFQRPSLADVGQRQNRGLLEEATRSLQVHPRPVGALVNQSYVGSEISEMLQLPPRLDKFWPNRGITGQPGTIRARSTVLYGVV